MQGRTSSHLRLDGRGTRTYGAARPPRKAPDDSGFVSKAGPTGVAAASGEVERIWHARFSLSVWLQRHLRDAAHGRGVRQALHRQRGGLRELPGEGVARRTRRRGPVPPGGAPVPLERRRAKLQGHLPRPLLPGVGLGLSREAPRGLPLRDPGRPGDAPQARHAHRGRGDEQDRLPPQGHRGRDLLGPRHRPRGLGPGHAHVRRHRRLSRRRPRHAPRPAQIPRPDARGRVLVPHRGGKRRRPRRHARRCRQGGRGCSPDPLGPGRGLRQARPRPAPLHGRGS